MDRGECAHHESGGVRPGRRGFSPLCTSTLDCAFDEFRFNLVDRLVPANSGLNDSANPEPKVNVIYTPADRLPLSIHFNYGRAVTSQDARGMALDPTAPRVAATNFYMIGTSHNLKRFSASTDMFLIDRQHEDALTIRITAQCNIRVRAALTGGR